MYFKNIKKYYLFLIIFSVLFFSCIKIFAQGTIKPYRPKLIIGIVVEQMRYDYIERYWEKYESGGFKKLYNGGMICNQAHYNHLFVQAGVSHATISTGSTPSVHGIIGTNWYDVKKNSQVYCVQDEKPFTMGSDSYEGRRSAQYLESTTFAEELLLSTSKKSKAISISVSDYASILSIGNLGTAFWFDERAGAWITNSNYVSELPKWVTDFNNEFLPDLYLTKTWNTILPIEKYTESQADDSKLEQGFLNEYKTFPYELSRLNKQMREYSLLKMTPFSNLLTKDFAIKAIQSENLGKDDYTDLLLLNFSATHEIGKLFGPESIEVEDAFLRLDRDLAHLIMFLDSFVGNENYLIYFTSSHGSQYSTAYLEEMKMPTGFFNQGTAISLLKAYLRNKFGNDAWVLSYSNQQFYFDRRLIENKKMSYSTIEKESIELLKEFTGVANVVGASNLQDNDLNKYPFNFIQNSYYYGRSGDILINLLPNWSENVKDRTYNSFYSYNAHVPLIWYGWKITPQIINRKIEMTDIAPTISTLLNVAMPSGATGKPIEEFEKIMR